MNIFVASINYKAKWQDIKELFEKYGTVKHAKILTDKETNRSRGIGFVEMPNDEEALEAIKNLNQYEFMGRKLAVNEAKPKAA